MIRKKEGSEPSNFRLQLAPQSLPASTNSEKTFLYSSKRHQIEENLLRGTTRGFPKSKDCAERSSAIRHR